MRRATVVVGLLLVLLFVTNVAAEGYRVILKNGSYVQAREKPVAEGANARIRLSGGGVAVVPASSIDWEATERWHKTADLSQPAAKGDQPAPKTVPSGTITMVGDPQQDGSREGNAQAPASAPGASAGAEPADNSLSQKRQHYNELEAELGRLRTQKAGLEQRAHSSVNLDEAGKLREQAANLETRIQRILAQQKNLIVEGEVATSHTGDDQETRRRIRFLDAQISKLRQEKAQLEEQAHNQISLDDAKVMRDKADGLFAKIQALETEREGLNARLSQ